MVIQESISAENTKEKKCYEKIHCLGAQWGHEAGHRQTDKLSMMSGYYAVRSVGRICRYEGPIDPRLR